MPAAVVSLTDDLPLKHDSPYTRSLQEFLRHRVALVALAVVVIIVVASIFASRLSSYDPIGRNAKIKLMPPSAEYVMGTDALGRDVLTRTLYGGQISLQVGFFSIGLAALIGVPLGLIAGYSGGKVDNVIMRIMDLILAFPGLILIIWLVGMLGASLLNVVIAIALFSLPTYARLARGQTLSLYQRDFVLAARCIGAKGPRIMFSHILPNILGSLIVITTLGVSDAIITGASLSFLGLGVRPPTPEWGAMLSDGRGYLRNAWWISFFPGMTITLLVLALNTVGDALRDAFDPNTLSK
ncbi:MAG: ABC transporter permease [Anaerolineae bacterium]|nr:ABC transporter permease [Anaerolineae bacterium]